MFPIGATPMGACHLVAKMSVRVSTFEMSISRFGIRDQVVQWLRLNERTTCQPGEERTTAPEIARAIEFLECC